MVARCQTSLTSFTVNFMGNLLVCMCSNGPSELCTVTVAVLICVTMWRVQLLVNYGIVEDDNPYDKLQLTATIPHSDPLFQVLLHEPAAVASSVVDAAGCLHSRQPTLRLVTPAVYAIRVQPGCRPSEPLFSQQASPPSRPSTSQQRRCTTSWLVLHCFAAASEGRHLQAPAANPLHSLSLQGLPDNLLPYLRLAHAESEMEVSCCSQGVRDLKQVHTHLRLACRIFCAAQVAAPVILTAHLS